LNQFISKYHEIKLKNVFISINISNVLSKNAKPNESDISICNIMKDRTSEIVKKIESEEMMEKYGYESVYSVSRHQD
jgi:hypothetical protein